MVSLLNIFSVFFRAGIYSFNAGATEVLLTQVVEKRQWLDHLEYARILSLASLIPGPFHVNLVITTGYALAGLRGCLISLSAFVMPGFLIALVIAHVLSQPQVLTWLLQNSGLIIGVVAAVTGILLSAIVRLGMRVIGDLKSLLIVIALASGILFLEFPFALIICCTGLFFVLSHLLHLRKQ